MPLSQTTKDRLKKIPFLRSSYRTLKTAYRTATRHVPRLAGIPTYLPGQWGTSPTSDDLTLFVCDNGGDSQSVSICRALLRRRLHLFGLSSQLSSSLKDLSDLKTFPLSKKELRGLYSAVKAKCALFFDADELSEWIEKEWLPSDCAVVLCSAATSKISRERVRHFSFDTKTQTAAFIASRLEELIVEMTAPIDSALQRSLAASAKKAFVRRAALQNSWLPPAREVTFLIPTYKGANELPSCLESIRSQRIYGDSDILVIDSDSPDRTLDIAQTLGAKTVSISQRDFNHGATRDYALSLVDTPFAVLMVQDATLLDSESIPNLLRHLHDPMVAGAYTSSVPVASHDEYARYEPTVHRKYLGPYAKTFRMPRPSDYKGLSFHERYQFCRFDNVCSAIRRSVWKEIPFGKINFGEDIAWSKRTQLAGYEIVYDPFARVIHSHERPSDYGYRRGVVQAIAISEMLEACESHLRNLPWEAIETSERLLESDVVFLRASLADEGTVDTLREALSRRHRDIQAGNVPKGSSKTEIYRTNLFANLAAIYYDRAGEERLERDGLLSTIDKVHAVTLGALIGDYASALKFGGKNIPTPLAARIREASLGV